MPADQGSPGAFPSRNRLAPANLTVPAPGMRGKVLSLHDGFHLDVAEVEASPPRAIVQFESGFSLMVDAGLKWEKAN